MKKVALTVAVLTLGLAACQDNAPDNNTSTVNTVETEAAADTNDAANTADNALDAAGNAVQDAGNSVDNAANAADNAG
jgi:predicted component of type VI protein secretion system